MNFAVKFPLAKIVELQTVKLFKHHSAESKNKFSFRINFKHSYRDKM